VGAILSSLSAVEQIYMYYVQSMHIVKQRKQHGLDEEVPQDNVTNKKCA
jgi:hypothetical protein